MKRLAVILLGCLAAGMLSAQNSAISRSGQFIINGVPPGAPRPFVPEVATNTALVKLEPATLVVSCERIKTALLAALTVGDQWRGKILISLHPVRFPDEDIVVATTKFSDVWYYEISLPDVVAPARLIRALTQVLLLEMTDRQTPPQHASLPAWLAEGMPQYLVAITDIDLVLKPAPAPDAGLPTMRREFRETRRVNLFAQARDRLRQREPLTLEELSQPEDSSSEVFRDNAMLFIGELLQLKGGGDCLAAMLPELPWDPDWRVAFLKGFKPHFKRTLDFEKWWALQSAYFAGRGPTQNWTRPDTLAKLQQVLRTPFEVRLGSNEAPMFTDVSVQAILKGWRLDRQLPVLRDKVNLLQQLQLRAAPELKPLTQQYRDVLTAYLDRMGAAAEVKDKTNRSARHPTNRKPKPAAAPAEDDPVLRDTLAQLDVLDERRDAWRVNQDKLPELPAAVTPAPPPETP